MSRTLHAGFVPLVDAAPLIAAAECGFAEAEGITLELVRQNSWASLRDHLNLGHLDCAQTLAPLPIAAVLGIGQVRSHIAVPFVLSRGGNAITLSMALVEEICKANGGVRPAGARAWGRALAIALRQRRNPLTFAMVYPFSGHNFEIRYWLAAAGIHPDRDLRLIAIPPPLMVESMRAGQIDGFCVGAPWNSIAAIDAVGEIVATKSEIFPHGIEKVLGMARASLDDEATTRALIRALDGAAEWCDKPENHATLAAALADPKYLGTDPELTKNVLAGSLPMTGVGPDADYLYFHRHDANRPRRADTLWIYAQMVRWGQIPARPDFETAAVRVFRPDIYEQALDLAEPKDPKPITACDRETFDGRSVAAYLQSFDLATPFGSTFPDL